MRSRNSEINEKGLEAAKLFKYYKQYDRDSVVRKIPLNRVSATVFYTKHRKTFDRLVELFGKHGLDIAPYIKFYTLELHRNEESVDADMLSPSAVMKFQLKLMHQEKIREAFAGFRRTAEFIAGECMRSGIETSKEFIERAITSGKIGAMYMSGQLSKYYLAAIPKFADAVSKFDYFSKLDLQCLADRYEIYMTEINEACMKYTHSKADPFAFTDGIISERRGPDGDPIFDDTI